MDQAQLNWITNFIWSIAEVHNGSSLFTGDAMLMGVATSSAGHSVTASSRTTMSFLRKWTPPSRNAISTPMPRNSVSFTRHFYQSPHLRTLAQISADILALEQETEGLLHEITKGATA